MNLNFMDPREHIHLTGSALKKWAVGQIQDSIAVALLWFVGLWILQVPWAPLWALLAAALQVVPHLGPVLSLLGPVLSALIRWQDWEDQEQRKRRDKGMEQAHLRFLHRHRHHKYGPHSCRE